MRFSRFSAFLRPWSTFGRSRDAFETLWDVLGTLGEAVLGQSWVLLNAVGAALGLLWTSWAYHAKKYRKSQKVPEILAQLGRQNEGQNH